MTEALKKALVAIWDKSATDGVDVMIACAKVRQDVREGVNVDLTFEELDAAWLFAVDNYTAICEAYNSGDWSAFEAEEADAAVAEEVADAE